MQIGHPTDVKHLAHIGWECTPANSPSWVMNEFGTSPEPSSGASNCNTLPTYATKYSAKDSLLIGNSDMQKSSGAPTDSPTRNIFGETKPSRRQIFNGSVGSPGRAPLGSNKPRRKKNSILESSTRELSTRPRRLNNSSLGSESPQQEPPVVAKQSRKKKPKASSNGGSMRSSISKGQELTGFPDPEFAHVMKNQEKGPDPVLEAYEGNECDEISRRIRGL
ncbi:unnamed protein product [Ilex paraguariensis]|uniref:CRIB domain-containing protein n=1 Tax=Ilex paraguariensis TaxID=185542 RepID=A0ABC8U8J8_9AQUA